MKSSLIDIPQIKNFKGDIFKILKSSDEEFNGFGEIYISNVKRGEIKAWKKHLRMTCILIPISGQTKVVVYDKKYFHVFKLDSKKKKKLIIPPNTIFGFSTIKDDSSIMNIANIEHNQNEVDTKSIEQIDFNWRIDK